MLATAAVIAVAFASGVWWEVRNSSHTEPDLPKVARQNNDSRAKGLDDGLSQEANRHAGPGRDAGPRGVPSELLTFVVDHDDGETDRFELPIYDADDSHARQLLQGSPSMPADVERAIRDSGFQVRRQRQWARVRLHDGRRAFFPVDQLEITPVSGNIYH